MKNIKTNIDPDSIIKIKKEGVAAALDPTVFKDGDSYCCIFGSDPQSGVFGCGDTPEEALIDWDKNLRTHLSCAGDHDEVVEYVKAIINSIPKVVPPHVQAFYDQFRPVDRNKTRKKNK
nr:hypothetical protein [uncultured Pedobacter sp.]